MRMKQLENVSPEHVSDENVEFKGYTIEQLKYQRALIALRKEFVREQIMQTVQQIRPQRKKNDSPAGGSKMAVAKLIGSKLLNNLNTLDYVMVGMSLFGTVKKIYHLFKNKKK